MKKYILILFFITLSITNFSIVRANIVFVDLDKTDHVIRVKPFPLVITPKPNSTIEDFKKTEKKLKDKEIKLFNNHKYFIII